MKEYIFGQRNGIYIIDLQKTLKLFKDAVGFISQVAARGRPVLFVGTKHQAQDAVEEEAQRCGMYFVNNRWLGGLLTNFTTIQNSIKRYKELEQMRIDGSYSGLSKKEVARLERERKRFEKNLRGIRDLDQLPGALFVIDSNREAIAVREAVKLRIPVVAIVDTNSDPSDIDYVIPGNDDALRAVRLFTSTIADAVRAGRAVYEAKVEAELKEAKEKAAREAAARRAERKAREEALARAQALKEQAEAAAASGDQAQTPAEQTTEAKSRTDAAPTDNETIQPQSSAPATEDVQATEKLPAPAPKAEVVDQSPAEK